MVSLKYSTEAWIISLLSHRYQWRETVKVQPNRDKALECDKGDIKCQCGANAYQ